MLRQATETDLPVLRELLNTQPVEDLFRLRMRSTLRCYGTGHPDVKFYLAAPGETAPPFTGVLCVQGTSALYAGDMQDAEELESFLRFCGVQSFLSTSMLLPGWLPQPRYLMHLPVGARPQVFTATVEETPNLWKLAHSGVLENIDPEAWYADACVRTNRGEAAVCAIAVPDAAGQPQYVSTAGVYAVEEAGVYINAVATKKEHRGCGYGCTLMSTLAKRFADRDAYLLCAPERRSFYEQLGWRFARPVCVYHAPHETP